MTNPLQRDARDNTPPEDVTKLKANLGPRKPGRPPTTGTYDRVTVRLSEPQLRELERIIATGEAKSYAAAIRVLIDASAMSFCDRTAP